MAVAAELVGPQPQVVLEVQVVVEVLAKMVETVVEVQELAHQ
jgi:hypothetical protein